MFWTHSFSPASALRAKTQNNLKNQILLAISYHFNVLYHFLLFYPFVSFRLFFSLCCVDNPLRVIPNFKFEIWTVADGNHQHFVIEETEIEKYYFFASIWNPFPSIFFIQRRQNLTIFFALMSWYWMEWEYFNFYLWNQFQSLP